MNRNRNLPMLCVLYGAAFVAAFNENIINVALISIMGEFSVSATTAQWLVTGYMIVTAIVVTVTAFLSKRLRLKTLFLTASGFLIVGLAADFVAPSFPLFLAARLVQAVGTGIFIPVMMSTVLAVAPRTKLGTFLSIGGSMITLGPALAPVVSGLMVTAFGWRSVLLPPAMLILLLAVAGAALIRNIGEPEKVRLDVASVLLSAVGLTALMFGLSIIMSQPAIAVAALAVGVAAGALFVRRERLIANPLLNLQPLGSQNPTAMDLTATLAVVRDMRNLDERVSETLDASVMDIATTSIVAVTETTSIDEVCAILSSKRIKKVPVLRNRQVLGTISRADIVRALMGAVVTSQKA